MARRTFFSFHYERDAWRAGQIRNCWVTQDRESAGFWDAADWESVKRNGESAIHRWIDNQLSGTSVTVVLIGAETAQRQYVSYEIKASHLKGSGMLGIYVHNLKDARGLTDVKGANPFSNWNIQENGRTITLDQLYPTYDWVLDNGRGNIAFWIEAAARKANR